MTRDGGTPRPIDWGDHATDLRPKVDAPAIEVSPFVLTVVAGPDRGKSLRVDGAQSGRVSIGKSEACELAIRDPRVSRRHAAITVEPSRLRLSDLGSSNGTRLNRVPIIEAFLGGGEMIEVGDSTIRVERASEVSTVRISAATCFGRIVGASIAMRRLFPICERLALSDVPVILEGETGTGKELFAEALHEASPRASEPFIVFDCTTPPSTLMEAALFGHERGAFTGADHARAGVFEQADGGTLFIDEIGDLDLALQGKLLRAIQEGEVQRLGSAKWTRVDVRIIAATRRDLERAIQAGRFRDDLYYRLAVARLEIPPLRQRAGDIPILAGHFWQALGGSGNLPDAMLAPFEDYAWPGNVRELANAVAHRIALGDLADPRMRGAVVEGGPGDVRADAFADQAVAAGVPFATARRQVIDAFERRYLERVLAAQGGNVSKAAQASGIARRYFYVVRSRLGGAPSP